MKAERAVEAEHEGKFNVKVAFVENRRASVRHWYRVLAKLHANKLEINIQLEDGLQEVGFHSAHFDI